MAKQIAVKVTGQSKVKALLDRAASLPHLIFAQGQLERLLLGRTKGRFGPQGSSSTAQKAPSGAPWKPLAESTLRGGRKNSHKLVDSGELLQSIAIIRTNMSASALASPTGGGFRIGIRPGSPAEAYARVQNFGGASGRNGTSRIPMRRYLGIGNADVKSVNDFIYRMRRKAGV